MVLFSLAVALTAADAGAQEKPAAARGEYILRAGVCAGCHTDSKGGGGFLAGGRPLETPFGIFYSPNITPDPETGIGGWSAADFTRAMGEGIAPDGSHYFPVFPYTAFTGMTAADLSFENMYDGFALFHQFHLEGLRFRGMQNGDALDFYQTDISIEGPNPVLPSGGNIGSGRSRFWMHTDCIQQIQGRAGARQITGIKPEIGVSGGPMPMGGNFTVWSATPD